MIRISWAQGFKKKWWYQIFGKILQIISKINQTYTKKTTKISNFFKLKVDKICPKTKTLPGHELIVR